MTHDEREVEIAGGEVAKRRDDPRAWTTARLDSLHDEGDNRY